MRIIKLFSTMIDYIHTVYIKYQMKRDYKKRMKELRKSDPFIYK